MEFFHSLIFHQILVQLDRPLPKDGHKKYSVSCAYEVETIAVGLFLGNSTSSTMAAVWSSSSEEESDSEWDDGKTFTITIKKGHKIHYCCIYVKIIG